MNTLLVCEGLVNPAGPLMISYTTTPVAPLGVAVIVPLELQVEGVVERVILNCAIVFKTEHNKTIMVNKILFNEKSPYTPFKVNGWM